MIKFNWVCGFIVMVNSLQAQSYVADSTLANKEPDFAKHFYFTQRGEESAIYNGLQHDEYAPSIEGHAYFQSPAWQNGWVKYDNMLYENIIMKYDLLKDQLIVAPKDSGEIFIALFSPRVSEFSFNGFHFVRAEKAEENALTTGFYQQLVQGKITALAKRAKIIEEKVIGTTVTHNFQEEVKYYLCKTGTCYPIKNEKSILEVMNDQRKEIQQFLSKNKLNYRKSPERTIREVAEFYNKLGF
jgi:hypothetical protein